MKIVMTLCPNCRTIQKAGTVCGLCKCPVEAKTESSVLVEKEETCMLRVIIPAEGVEK